MEYVIEVWIVLQQERGQGKKKFVWERKNEKKKVVGDRQNVTEKRKSQKGGEVNFNKITRFEDLKI